jgi:glucokinase
LRLFFVFDKDDQNGIIVLLQMITIQKNVTMPYTTDNRIVMTLDAGGTNFVFSAARAGEEIIAPISLPARASTLEQSLQTIRTGFEQVKSQLSEQPVAISFAFPGPADYPNGIIGDLKNLPTFRGGVALGPMLDIISAYLPSSITTVTCLYTVRLLPAVACFHQGTGNRQESQEVQESVRALRGNRLWAGDWWWMAGYFWVTIPPCRDLGDAEQIHPHAYAEEGVAIRLLRRVYAQEAGLPFEEAPEPRVISRLRKGRSRGMLMRPVRPGASLR